MAFDPDKKHPHNPKEAFGASVGSTPYEGAPESEINVNVDPETIFVAGEADPEETAAQKTARQAKARDARDPRLDEAKDGDDNDSSLKAESGDASIEGWTPYKEGLWARTYSRSVLKIQDNGEYFSVSGKGRKINPMTGEREITDPQLRRLLMKGVLEKGWTNEIYLMKNGRIDAGLTARAEQMMQHMTAPGGPCEGYSPTFKQTLPKTVPWADGGVRGYMHNRAVAGEEKRAAKAAAKEHKELVRCGKHFKAACEDGNTETAADKMARSKEQHVAAAPPADEPVVTPPSAGLSFKLS